MKRELRLAVEHLFDTNTVEQRYIAPDDSYFPPMTFIIGGGRLFTCRSINARGHTELIVNLNDRENDWLIPWLERKKVPYTIRATYENHDDGQGQNSYQAIP